MSKLFRYEDALIPNFSLFLYIASAYSFGIWGMLQDEIGLNLLSVTIFAHSMVIAAYAVHECAHNSVFRKNAYHRWLAEILLWVCGCSYSHYDDIRHKHVRHHTDRADIVSFDYRTRITLYPLLYKLIIACEWLYIPMLEIIMHVLVIILPFTKSSKKQRRTRVITVLVIRLGLFVWLASISLSFILFYALAYLLFLTVMRFMDVHQHTYELFETLDKPRGDEAKLRDRKFEQMNTYSNLLSNKYHWLNLLVLNFCYHNAHHEQPGVPWYKLQSLHRQLQDKTIPQVLKLRELIKSYHHYRVPRILNADAINTPVIANTHHFIGVDGVSFLTAH